MNFNRLISCKEVHQLLDHPDLLILDVRHDLAEPDKGRWLHQECRIPGSLYLHLDEDLSGEIRPGNGRHPLPSLEKFNDVLRKIGLEPHHQVVIYDDMSGGISCRLWWMLQETGHRRTAVLDGGFDAWVRAGLPMESGSVSPVTPSDMILPGDFSHWIELTPNLLPQLTVVDARAPERHAGQIEPLDPIPGRIPGALNRFWKNNLTSEGFFRSPEELRHQYAGLTNPIFYCGSGVSACHDVFCFRLAGYSGERLYPGSWSKWLHRHPQHIETS